MKLTHKHYIIVSIIAAIVAAIIIYKIVTKKTDMVEDLDDRIIFTELVKENTAEFILRVKAISARLKINPNWLMAVMFKESRINSRAVNSISGATGLIQFMPSTAVGLGTTTSKLKAMSNLDQLFYVEKYFKNWSGRMKSFNDVYLVVFFPAAIPKPSDWTFKTSKISAETIGRQNSGINGGNPITKISFRNYLLRSIEDELHPYLA